MNSDEKKLLVSLIHAVENLLIEKDALERFAQMQPLPPDVRKAAVAVLLDDQNIGGIARLRFQHIVDQVEHAPDVSTVVRLLLSILQESSKG